MKDISIKVTSTGHFWTENKEEVYFIVEGTMPRVGVIRARYIADRYVARVWGDGQNEKPHDAWTKWRMIRSQIMEPSDGKGLGPVALSALSDAVEIQVTSWLSGDEYEPSRKRAWSAMALRQRERYWRNTRAT